MLTVAEVPAFARFESPSVVRWDGQWVLYMAAWPVDPNDPDETLAPVLVRSASADARSWATPEVVFGPETACTDSEVVCPIVGGIGTPEVRVATTGAGRAVLRLWFSSGDGARETLLFAASYDGQSFALFERNPVLTETRYDLWGATNVFDGERYLLFLNRDRPGAARGIVQAVHETPNPVERF